MRLLAPAKINLHLRVGARDELGFHPLRSWMCTVGLFDEMTIQAGASSLIRLICDDPNLPCDQENLIVRAAEVLRANRSVGCEISLQKRIPIGGGLGGGSSDAARTLLGLNRLWQLRLPLDRLHDLAAQIGSDVPFFLHGPSNICTGRGQIVHPIARPKPRWALLVFPGFSLATADVYDMSDRLRRGNVQLDADPRWEQWTTLTAIPLLSRLVNDLEPAAFALAPELGELRRALEEALGRVIRMTGSGSGLFTLFDQREEAESAAQMAQAQFSLRAVVVEVAPRIDDDLSRVGRD